jgi:serine/threonine-protein kinase
MERTAVSVLRPSQGQRMTSVEETSERPGNVIGGKYELVSRLDEGGMGALWIAHNTLLDVDVAIKLIRADIKHLGTQLADRLLLEARACAKLGHPAIVRILDYGKTELGDPYIVMELLHGEDLGTALERRGRISAKKTVRILLPIAHALAVAHEKGIVHRDIKPENIFLSKAEDGSVQPKLIDFGIAKHRPDETNARITQLGQMMGSPGYMSPEQARGEDCDQGADIWSLCIVLYEMITGRLPFEGKNFQSLLRSIIEDTVPPIVGFRAGDDDLWAILETGLHKNADERWPSMRALGRALARWAVARSISDDVCGGSLEAVWLSNVTPGNDALLSLPPPRTRASSPPPGADELPDFVTTAPPASVAARSQPGAPDSSADAVPSAPRSADPNPRSSLVEQEQLPRYEPAPASRPPPIYVVAAVLLALGGFAIYRLTQPAPTDAVTPAATQTAPAPDIGAATTNNVLENNVLENTDPTSNAAAPAQPSAAASPEAAASTSARPLAPAPPRALVPRPPPRAQPPAGTKPPPAPKATASAGLKKPQF